MSQKTHLTLGAIAVAGVVVALVTYAITIVGAVIAMLFTPLGSDLLSVSVQLPIGAFFFLSLPSSIRSNLFVFSAGFIAVFILCFIAAIRNENGVAWGLKQLRQGSLPVGLPNWLAIMPLVSSSLLSIVILITLLLSAGGVSSGGLPLPTTPSEVALDFGGIIYAPIREEMAIRITFIGFFVWVRAGWNARIQSKRSEGSMERRISKTRLFISSFYSPEKSKAMVGVPRVATHGWRGVHWSEWILLIFTSVIFGLLHILSNVGWEAGKAVTAGLSGFALGLVYLTYGAYANILLHWFFNFYVYIFSLSVYSGALLLFADTMDVIIFLLSIFLGVLGIVMAIVWVNDRPQKSQPTYTTGATFG